MTALAWHGIFALALVVLVFLFVRSIRAYVAVGGLTVLGFAVATRVSADFEGGPEWIVMVAALVLCIFGLLIVRVMFIRSVSLNILRSIERGGADSFGEDIGARLGDMRSFRLIQTVDGQNALTAFGRLVSTIVAVFYAVFRIQA